MVSREPILEELEDMAYDSAYLSAVGTFKELTALLEMVVRAAREVASDPREPRNRGELALKDALRQMDSVMRDATPEEMSW